MAPVRSLFIVRLPDVWLPNGDKTMALSAVYSNARRVNQLEGTARSLRSSPGVISATIVRRTVVGDVLYGRTITIEVSDMSARAAASLLRRLTNPQQPYTLGMTLILNVCRGCGHVRTTFRSSRFEEGLEPRYPADFWRRFWAAFNERMAQLCTEDRQSPPRVEELARAVLLDLRAHPSQLQVEKVTKPGLCRHDRRHRL